MGIIKFFWQIIKPYKWWYLLMMQAPFVSAIYAFSSNYAIKMIVDVFTANNNLSFAEVGFPVFLYIGSVLVLETSWRVSQYSWMRSQPNIRAEIFSQVYCYIQGQSWTYFQNTASGSIVSKIKGIVDGYNNLWAGVHHKISENLLCCIACIVAFAFVRVEIFWFMILWSLCFLIVFYFTSKKIQSLSTKTANSKHFILGKIADNITNIFNIILFSSQKRELGDLTKSCYNDMAKNDSSQIKWEIIQNIAGTILYCLMLFSLFIFMIDLRIKNIVTTSDFVFVMTLAWYFIEKLWTFFINLAEFVRNLGDFKSSFSLLQVPQNNLDKSDAVELNILK